MAKRGRRHPALRGYQVWRWWGEKGILEAKPLGKTLILVVQRAARVRLTSKYRTTISQGIFLIPRWIKLPEKEREKFSHLSEEKLKGKGIITDGDTFCLLIYQQVEDIDHLLRQQHYILFDGKRTRVAKFDLFIKPEIEARKEAALQLKRWRTKQLQDIRERRIIPLLKRFAAPEEIPDWEIEGMVNYLGNIITELDEIIERPLVTRRKRAQRSLRAAQRWIKEKNFDLAKKRLEKAIENLVWPKEKR